MQLSPPVNWSRASLRLVIYGLICFSFFTGVPQIHYCVALMVALIIRHKDEPGGLFSPVQSYEVRLASLLSKR